VKSWHAEKKYQETDSLCTVKQITGINLPEVLKFRNAPLQSLSAEVVESK